MGNPIALADAPEAETRFAPRLGEHTADVMTALLGLSRGEIDDLTAKGVIRSN
jgi:crotonobetainyl-CoA:carnitine CoA-transferase CaiB-like acyl-CoA transferase